MIECSKIINDKNYHFYLYPFNILFFGDSIFCVLVRFNPVLLHV
jgi:hypothetical protein